MRRGWESAGKILFVCWLVVDLLFVCGGVFVCLHDVDDDDEGESDADVDVDVDGSGDSDGMQARVVSAIAF